MVDQQRFYEEVGRRIREARKNRKPSLTQEGLAELVSLTRTSITNLEKGRQKFLVHTLADIATALHVPASSLLPQPNGEVNRKLEEVLKDRPKSEKDWIKSTLSAAKKERDVSGS